jgi:hypothetical protein
VDFLYSQDYLALKGLANPLQVQGGEADRKGRLIALVGDAGAWRRSDQLLEGSAELCAL